MLRAGVAGSKQSWHATKRLPAEPSVAYGIASTAGIYKERRAGKARPRVGCCMQRVESVFADRHYVQPGVENAASTIVSANTPPCCCAFGHYSDEREQEVDDFRDIKEGGKKGGFGLSWNVYVLCFRGSCCRIQSNRRHPHFIAWRKRRVFLPSCSGEAKGNRGGRNFLSAR